MKISRTTLAICVAMSFLIVPAAAVVGAPSGARAAIDVRESKPQGPFRIDVIRYAQNGDNLNTEWIQVRNITRRPHSLRGWRIVDVSDGRRYRFPPTRVPGKTTLTVYTGRGYDRFLKRYWRLNSPTWGNNRDEARLLDASGRFRDGCLYKGGAVSTDCLP